VGQVAPAGKPGPSVDWVVVRQGGSLQLANISTGRNLSVAGGARLVQSGLSSARWRFDADVPCFLNFQ
jgi:hypothetical protein